MTVYILKGLKYTGCLLNILKIL